MPPRPCRPGLRHWTSRRHRRRSSNPLRLRLQSLRGPRRLRLRLSSSVAASATSAGAFGLCLNVIPMPRHRRSASRRRVSLQFLSQLPLLVRCLSMRQLPRPRRQGQHPLPLPSSRRAAALRGCEIARQSLEQPAMFAIGACIAPAILDSRTSRDSISASSLIRSGVRNSGAEETTLDAQGRRSPWQSP